MPNAVPALVILAAVAGWTVARYRRARADLSGAKDGVTKARRSLGVERKPFVLAIVIVFFIVWWWLAAHS